MSANTSVPTSKAVPYYLPQPDTPAGTAFHPQPNGAALPKVFQPLKVKNVTFQNRIQVSPMCMYSANDNLEATPFHLIHYGSFLSKGPGLTIVESTAVLHEGALSPHDLGLWTDEQATKLKEIVDYSHAQKQSIAIQLGHGGRKASGQPLWVHLEQIADESVGGWPNDVVAPSAIKFRPKGNYLTPKEMSKDEIKRTVKAFGLAAKRAVEIAGFDAVEIHGAHGYLINEFLSSISNKRTDEYGGSFENRLRFLSEVIDEIKSSISKDVLLMLRISASDNAESDPESWKVEDSKKLAKIVAEKGIDIIDISSGGNDYKQDRRGTVAFNAELAREVKKAVGDSAIISCVGGLNDPKETNRMIEEGYFDLVAIGKGFLKSPSLVWEWADELNVKIHQIPEYFWPFYPKREGIVELIKRQDANP
ncbi:uncharacterized protein PRCAT00004763001 [Priceomyces carsonii]|uniref:uncharacterized protein n=1 Tax=Priceomyces carsonii TaxID=28549 RepID=UPI002EDA31E5|nr:unnamed protein product [Priceomyces carsonii]